MRAVAVFDVDDTLYLERDYVRSGFHAVDEHLRATVDCEGFADVAWGLFLVGVRGHTFDRALDRLGIESTPGRLDDLVRVYRGHIPNIDLLPDAAVTLGECRDRNMPIAVVTDGPSVSQWAKVDALGLRAIIDPVFVTEDHGPDWRKPSTKAFEAIQERFGMPGDCHVYIADNPTKDFAGPKRLGWRTIRVRRPDSLHWDIPSGRDVDATVTSLAAAGPGPLADLLFQTAGGGE